MTETIHKENLKSLLNQFETALDNAIASSWKETGEREHLHQIVKGQETITHQILELGNHANDLIQDPNINSTDLFSSYVIQFVWMEDVKSFLILWRDIIFEYQKALVLKSQGKATMQGLAQLQAESNRIITSSSEDLKSLLEKETRTIGMDAKILTKKISNWSKQTAPWITYKEQIEELREQGKKMLEQEEQLLTATNEFEYIRGHVLESLECCKAEVMQLKMLAEEAIGFIRESVEEKPGKVAIQLEDMESKIEKSEGIVVLNDGLKDKVEEMIEKIQVPVSTDGGLLLYTDVNLKRMTRQWLDAEILPLSYELWEMNDQIINSFKMALLNIRNRALLFSNEKKTESPTHFDEAHFCNPLVTFIQKSAKWKEELSKISSTIKERMANEFYLSEIYNTEKPFLPIPLQSTINQYRLTQNPWIVHCKNWLGKQRSALQKFKVSVEQEESLSDSEKIIRYIHSREAHESNSDYSNIFLTRGYIGKSFWVGREQELSRFNNIFNEWKLGFRGATILSGQRFSGKSLFGEYVSNLHFYHNTIRLKPYSSIKVEGRILNTTYDLQDAIEFVNKYVTTQPLIWIDDLESWRDPNITLSQNVRALSNAVDNHGSKMFFLVSMGNWMLSHLDKTHQIQKIFQAEINLDKMSSDDIKNAILIRHGATHKTLINKEEEEPTPREFQKMISRIYRNSEGNIGEALTRWSYSIKLLDEDRVEHIPNVNYTLPDFFNPDISLLLSTLMMAKQTNEYRLSKLFGSPFKSKYHHLIQRLISIGVLKRHAGNWLEINELAVNEVGKALERKQYLKFYKT